MGTNYFAIESQKEERHIGKLSCGWEFLFHGYDEVGYEIKTFDEWVAYLLKKDVKILHNDDKEIDASVFFKIIKDSIGKKRHTIRSEQEEWYDENGFAFLNHYFC